MKNRIALFIIVFMITMIRYFPEHMYADNVLQNTEEHTEAIIEVAEESVHFIELLEESDGISLSEQQNGEILYTECSNADYEAVKAVMVEGIKNWQSKIDIAQYQISKDEMRRLHGEITKENPDLFYISKVYSYTYDKNKGNVFEYMPQYGDYTKEDVITYEAKVKEILAKIPEHMTDEDIALFLHDYLVTHCTYVTTNHDAYTTLVLGRAVCEGYSLAYSDLMNRCNIKTEYVGNSNINHMWNVVYINDNWYHVDVTWDDPKVGNGDLLGFVGHNNFLRSDAGMKETGHGDWQESRICTDTTYDTYYWSDITSAICFEDENTVYYMSDGILYERTNNIEKEISVTANDKWWQWGSNSVYFVKKYNSLILNEYTLYYNGNGVIYTYHLPTKQEAVYYTYGDNKGYIYGLTEALNGTDILLEIRTSPGEDEVDIVRIENVFYNEEVPPATNPFIDVPESMYYYQPVLWALENKVTVGINATEFAPEASCTRGQVVTFLWRAMGCPEPTTTTNPFVDVPEYEYYYKAVLWALENGITVGINATQFAPEQTVTRGQFVTFLYRAENKPSYTVNNPFSDVPNTYYYDAVLWAYENGITTGMDSTHFSPEDSCTRGQVVTFLYRALSEK